MTAATAAIANHLNIAEAVIASVEEWAHVLFVRFIGRRPRFVSKKVVEMEDRLYIKKSPVTYGSYYSESFKGVSTDWKMGLGLGIYSLQQYYHTAPGVYGSVFRAFNLFSSGSHCKMALTCPGATVVDQESGAYGGTCSTVAIPLNKATQQWAEKIYADYTKNEHRGMMQTSTGDWVMADDWDDIEGAM